MSYRRKLLERRSALGRDVRIGLVGAGQMGRGFIEQARRIEGMEVVAVADLQPGLAEASMRNVGVEDIVQGDGDTDKLAQAVDEGHHVTVDAAQLAALPLDIVIDASGVPSVGATTALRAILAGKDVGLLTVETDITVGLLLSRMAQRAGVVYTVCRGDEPVEAKRLVDYATDLGFEVICAGKGKNNVFNRSGNPKTLRDEAIGRGMNPKMLTSFVDGSKTMIEMAALSNATGLKVSKRGMHGPKTSVDRLASTFCSVEQGGVLERTGVVDYAMGPVAPGVFCTVSSDSQLVQEGMDYLKMGPGPVYTFYRPYHLANLEAPLTVAAAVFDRVPDLAPVAWTAEVVAAAKRPLKAGEALDGVGGYTVYGVVEDAAVASGEDFLPLGVCAGLTLTRDVAEDELLRWADVEVNERELLIQLRRLQDSLLADLTSSEGASRSLGAPADLLESGVGGAAGLLSASKG